MNSIFWSWQSDLDPRVTRTVVRDALAGAIEDLEAELEERHELTSDTQGVAGSPDIVSTILAKIDAAKVFVGDVTPIALSGTGKALANPNVLIELGYAKRAIGLERVIMVWNTAFPGATIENLPFDMRGRRAPMGFHLEPDATTADLRSAREGLRRQLTEALRLSIAVATPLVTPSFPEWLPADKSPALWVNPDRKLRINDNGAAVDKDIAGGPYRYARILPASWTRPADFGASDLRPSILGPASAFSYGLVRGGSLVFKGGFNADRPLMNLVFQSRETGELWGVDPFSRQGETGDFFFADGAIAHYYSFLRANLPLLAQQGARGPYKIILGVTELNDRRWTSQTRWGEGSAALQDSVEVAFTVSGYEESQWIDGLVSAWGEFAAAFGLSQPSRGFMMDQILGQ
ncbi:hypothetical protein AEAC466_10795 [Asticcacaulis sp. AC466]|uniref:hypothetical protein n=1 Tax=Asticcacaulis sp. AC466 TaxID=1282362 RepID=UPI0003C3D014|nr:hypothetical protein [Asticcacaulis sp. AC466]ESQ84224.1 hypothetical protein AEAC466_10795 [Asticcacaulis sp. AC466]